MSRIGKQAVAIARGVKVSPVKTATGTRVAIEGPKGKLAFEFRSEVSVDVKGEQVIVNRTGETTFHRAYHGTARALIANMVHGVSQGYEKRLEIVGVGYNAKVQGKKLVLQIGFCNPIELAIPDGLALEVPNPTTILVRGADKQLVGEFASLVRKVRPPEPYKGKGIRYSGEQITRKAGKAFGSGE